MITPDSQHASVAEALLVFWLGQDWRTRWPDAAVRRRWFSSTPADDRQMAARFGAQVVAALDGEMEEWATQADTRLALILLLDQLPRNIYRGKAQAFAGDGRALALAQSGIDNQMEKSLPVAGQIFFYMPLMHAESLAVQQQAVTCFEALHQRVPPALQPFLANNLKFAREHLAIIEEFGRFPHRNQALARASTQAELTYLDTAQRYGQ